jgi:hypothetical protein
LRVALGWRSARLSLECRLPHLQAAAVPVRF